MSRKPRFPLVGVPQHVIQRGNNREPCFHGAEDCQRYLNDLREAAGRNGCRLHAYVLMTNHVHLLVTPMQEHGVSHLMQDLGRKYVRYINHTYRRTGTLWEGRYKSSLIDSDAYLLTCMRYIELNPVTAGMVAEPGLYRWSSFRANAWGEPDRLLTSHGIYLGLGTSATARHAGYRQLFHAQLPVAAAQHIRNCIDYNHPLGNDRFRQEVEQMLGRKVGMPRRGRSAADIDAPK
jgi:putative transposase